MITNLRMELFKHYWSGYHRPGAAGAGPRPRPGAGAHIGGRDDRRHRHRRQDHQPEV